MDDEWDNWDNIQQLPSGKHTKKNYGKSPFSIRTIIRSKKRGPYKVGHLSGHLNPIFKLIDNNMYIYLSNYLSIYPSIYIYICIYIYM